MWVRVTYSSAHIFHLKKKREREILARSSASIPWVSCREWLAVPNLISEVA